MMNLKPASAGRTEAILLALFVVMATLPWTASPASAAFGIKPGTFKAEVTNPDGVPLTQAGAHADATVAFKLNSKLNGQGYSVPDGALRDVTVELPPGFIGDPGAVPTCSIEDFATGDIPRCPADSQIGAVTNDMKLVPAFPESSFMSAVYNLPTEFGQVARLGFSVERNRVIIVPRIRTGSDYGITADVRNAPPGVMVFGTSLTLWGVPADPAHDAERQGSVLGGRRPFFSNPTSCGASSNVSIEIRSWLSSDLPFADSTAFSPTTGCDQVPFSPAIASGLDEGRAGASTGLSFDLHLPQGDNPDGLATAHLKEARVTLPTGFRVNAATADGLTGCTEAQIDLDGPDAASCPVSSRIGTVEIETPLLDHPLSGGVHVATQNSNPFNSLLALYLAIDDPETGLVIKLAGKVSPDPKTGQLTVTFEDNPQLPFEDLHLRLNGGPQAPLTAPDACGTYTTVAELTSWAEPEEVVRSESTMRVDQGCGKDSQFRPGFEAGTVNPLAGSASPLTLRVTREDGEQNLAKIDMALPEGLLAKLAGIPLCPDAAAAGGACPAGSRIGSATVGVGAGSSPLFVPQPGKPATATYLAGPYKGASYSLIVEVPAQAGPFDLGTVRVRSAIAIDPVTAQVSVNSDPLPQILEGIPITYRDVRVDIDRPDFTRNPTSCDAMALRAEIGSALGRTADVASRFQVGGCERLGFEPKLALRLSDAPPRRGGHPKVTATLTMPKGGANVGKAVVTMPETQFFENENIRTICTRVQYAADNCPKGSVYGYAKAWTPLLDKPLQGPVYLRSSSNTLPDLVADLNGQIEIELAGRIDSVNSRLRTTFWSVPDAPVSKFRLTMQGARKGLLVNNTNLCAATPRADVRFTGQNGKVAAGKPKVKVAGCGKKQRK